MAEISEFLGLLAPYSPSNPSNLHLRCGKEESQIRLMKAFWEGLKKRHVFCVAAM